MGRQGVEVCTITVAERLAKADVRAQPAVQQLGNFAFQLVALEHGIGLSQCPYNATQTRCLAMHRAASIC